VNTKVKQTQENGNGRILTKTFRKIAQRAGKTVGSPWAFAFASLFVIFWILSGPFFHFSDTWQLVINTTTTIITFLMVFLLQNTQNRDTKALHLKLDELIYVNKKARNFLLDAEEELDDDALEREGEHFRKMRQKS
jgi:low affinity Fe/Cu permease